MYADTRARSDTQRIGQNETYTYNEDQTDR